MARPRILLTGFGPFPGVLVNDSADYVQRWAQAAQAQCLEADISAAVLATEWQRGLLDARALLAQVRPDIVLHFGVASAARGFVIEEWARNECGSRADACGGLPERQHIEPDGPDLRPVTVPAGEIVANLRRSRVPVSRSTDAGTYLCNAVLYQSLTLHAAANPDGATPMAGFVHIPQVVGRRGRLGHDQALRGGAAIIAACLAALEQPCGRQGLRKT